MDASQLVWTERYRPKKIEDCVLPDRFKKIFEEFVSSNNIDINLLLSGGPGVGKTTVAKALFNEIGADFIEINSSMNGNIDSLRNEIQNFASTVSLSGGRKMVLLDESDYLNPNSTQPALRNFFEQYAKNCGFVLTCNYPNRIIEPLRSRLTQIDFNITKKEMADLAPKFMKRVEHILDTEGVEYEKKAVAALIAKHFPDWRKCLNELQRYSKLGKIDSGILADFNEDKFKQLVKYMRSKELSKVRTWVAEHEDIGSSDFYRQFYMLASDLLLPNSVPVAILLLAKYQDYETRVPDLQINRSAFATEVMIECEFKE